MSDSITGVTEHSVMSFSKNKMEKVFCHCNLVWASSKHVMPESCLSFCWMYKIFKYIFVACFYFLLSQLLKLFLCPMRGY